MYEVKRYDGDGKLIEVVSPEKCLANFWKNFDGAMEIPEAKISQKIGSGMFHLITRVERTGPTKACQHCGDSFVPPRHKPQTKFCWKPGKIDSMQCRALNYRERNLKPQIDKNCEVCGTVFKTAHKRHRFCESPKCNRRSYDKKVRKKTNGLFKVCKYCGFEFWAKTGNHQYCILPYFRNALQCKTLAANARNG